MTPTDKAIKDELDRLRAENVNLEECAEIDDATIRGLRADLSASQRRVGELTEDYDTLDTAFKMLGTTVDELRRRVGELERFARALWDLVHHAHHACDDSMEDGVTGEVTMGSEAAKELWDAWGRLDELIDIGTLLDHSFESALSAVEPGGETKEVSDGRGGHG